MGEVALIGNAAAGGGPRFAALRSRLVQELTRLGWRADCRETGPEPGSAGRLAREAVERGAELVLACGGDGTVHGVLQGLAGTEATLGVLPFGTANALARNLGLPMEPVAALRALLGGSRRRIPLGRAEGALGVRYFAVLAGAGPDGALVEAAAARAGAKARWGRSAYYGRALRLMLTRRFPAFDVEYRLAGTSEWTRTEAAGVLAGRVPDLGGLFRRVCAGSQMAHGSLEVQIVRAPALVSFPAWIGMSHLRAARWNPWLRTVQVEELRCTSRGGRVAAQIDGEAFGPLPVALRVEPDALWLMVPGERAR